MFVRFIKRDGEGLEAQTLDVPEDFHEIPSSVAPEIVAACRNGGNGGGRLAKAHRDWIDSLDDDMRAHLASMLGG